MTHWKKFVFIRQKGMLRYIDRTGIWCNSLADAASFKSTWETCDFCFKKGLKGAEIVLRFGNPVREATIEVGMTSIGVITQ